MGIAAFSLPGFALPAITNRLGIPSVVTLHEQRIGQIADLGVPDNALRRLALRIAVHLLLLSDVVCVTTAEHRRALEKRRTSQVQHASSTFRCAATANRRSEPFPERPTLLMLTSHAPHKNLPLLAGRVSDGATAYAGRPIDRGRHRPSPLPGIPRGDADAVRPRPGSSGLVQFGSPTSEPRSVGQPTVVPYRATTGSSATVHQAINVGRPVVSADLPELRAMAEEEDLWLDFFPPERSGAAGRGSGSVARPTPAAALAMAQHNLRSAQRNSLTATTDRYLRLFQGQPGVVPFVDRHLAVCLWCAVALNVPLAATGQIWHSYDFPTHVFFASHYQRAWWSLWEPRWFDGFNVASYPPLTHQLSALLGWVVGIGNAVNLLTAAAVIVLPIPVFRLSRRYFGLNAARRAATVAVVTPSICWLPTRSASSRRCSRSTRAFSPRTL